ncbi:WhiB family transcriptional regulator [Gordonia alkanivorans]|uniref:4Fe-4S Wbl-type domain-containing protein n=1 Tax=Gordonia alkanivorans NBRC 16433 TaxID=1027371 RepID=F9VVE7_9ACTN|nr:WhiB family transcriptional regulator [Gordonia alkanivorans]GAA12576.1 hypothetical protein GOALK_056_00090 [Gordonia alkanivorans NBRC 16433]
MSHAKTLEPGVVSLLSEVLAGQPNLSGAACVDADPRLFDGWLPRERTESFDAAKARQERAVAVCGRCPVRADCRTWINDQPDRHLAAMVVGGRRPNLPGRKKGTTER